MSYLVRDGLHRLQEGESTLLEQVSPSPARHQRINTRGTFMHVVMSEMHNGCQELLLLWNDGARCCG